MDDECSDLESSLTAEESHELADDGGTIASMCHTYLGSSNTPRGMNAISGITEYRTTDSEFQFDTGLKREQVRNVYLCTIEDNSCFLFKSNSGRDFNLIFTYSLDNFYVYNPRNYCPQ